MGRPKLGSEYKKPSDYTYDYPEQREIGNHITQTDRLYIAKVTGYSPTHVLRWCQGTRRNAIIKAWAIKIQLLNIEKEKQLNQGIELTTNK